MTKGTGPSIWAMQQAEGILLRHPPCLRDDVPHDDLINDIADRLDDARVCGRADAEQGTENKEDAKRLRSLLKGVEIALARDEDIDAAMRLIRDEQNGNGK